MNALNNWNTELSELSDALEEEAAALRCLSLGSDCALLSAAQIRLILRLSDYLDQHAADLRLLCHAVSPHACRL